MMAADEDQHLAWLDDALLRSGASASWVASGECTSYGGHQWSLNVINARVDVTHNWREPRAAEVVARFLDRGRARHFAQKFGGLELVGRESDAHVAVGNDAFVITVGIDDLPDILRDQVRFQAIPSHVRKCIGEDLHPIQMTGIRR